MAVIERLHEAEITANLLASAAHVKAELYQIVDLVAGVSTDKELVVRLNSNMFAPFRTNQLGNGPLLRLQKSGVDKLLVTNDGQLDIKVTDEPPLIVASTIKVANLNADQIDGNDASDLAAAAHTHGAAAITSGTLDLARIPDLPTSKVTSGVFGAARGGTGISGYTTGNYIRAASETALEQRTPAQVRSDIGAAAASHTHGAADITSGELSLDRVPVLPAAKIGNLPASKVTTGTFSSARIPVLGTANTSFYERPVGTNSESLVVGAGGSRRGNVILRRKSTSTTQPGVMCLQTQGGNWHHLWNNDGSLTLSSGCPVL